MSVAEERPPWDGEHETSVPEKPSNPAAHATCTCGFSGPTHTGRDRRWQAMADADEHFNNRFFFDAPHQRG